MYVLRYSDEDKRSSFVSEESEVIFYFTLAKKLKSRFCLFHFSTFWVLGKTQFILSAMEWNILDLLSMDGYLLFLLLIDICEKSQITNDVLKLIGKRNVAFIYFLVKYDVVFPFLSIYFNRSTSTKKSIVFDSCYACI